MVGCNSSELPAGSVDSISVSPRNGTLGVGDSITFTATVESTGEVNRNVNWSSSNENIATVTNGLVTAKRAGSVTITATSIADHHLKIQ